MANEKSEVKKYWVGDAPKECFHGHPLTGTVFYDANLPGQGWCFSCHSHFQAHRGSLGVGRGQKYKRQPDKRWLKVGG